MTDADIAFMKHDVVHPNFAPVFFQAALLLVGISETYHSFTCAWGTLGWLRGKLQVAHSTGVTCEPEITEVELDASTDVMLVIATDGVWDVLSGEDVRKVRRTSYRMLFYVRYEAPHCRRYLDRYLALPGAKRWGGKKATFRKLRCRLMPAPTTRA